MAVEKSPDKIRVLKVLNTQKQTLEPGIGNWVEVEVGEVELDSHTTRTGLHDWTMGYQIAGLVGEVYIGNRLVSSTTVGGKKLQVAVDKYKASKNPSAGTDVKAPQEAK